MKTYNFTSKSGFIYDFFDCINFILEIESIAILFFEINNNSIFIKFKKFDRVFQVIFSVITLQFVFIFVEINGTFFDDFIIGFLTMGK